jgi:hypothetical protein
MGTGQPGQHRPWEADFGAGFARRLGRSPQELGLTSATESCPDIWELSNGDFAAIGREGTGPYEKRLPEGGVRGPLTSASSSCRAGFRWPAAARGVGIVRHQRGVGPRAQARAATSRAKAAMMTATRT